MRFSRLRKTPLLDGLLLLLSKWTPQFERVLLVESGSRKAGAKFLERIYSDRDLSRLDILTCYEAPPEAFDATRGEAFFTHKARGAGARAELLRRFRRTGYTVVCLLCTGDDIMTAWKWTVALNVPAKILLVNEGADTFWVDRGNTGNVARMLRQRAGEVSLPLSFLRLSFGFVWFPFTLIFLVAFAARMHVRRWWLAHFGNVPQRYNHSV